MTKVSRLIAPTIRRIRKADGGPLGDVDWSQMNKPFGGIAPTTPPISTRIGDEAQEGLVKAGMNPFAAEHLRQGFGGILDATPFPAMVDTVDAQARGDKWGVLNGMTRMIPGVGKVAGRFLPQMEREIPSLLARSGETGLLMKKSPNVAPPLTQSPALESQLSTNAVPSGLSTTRATTPSPTWDGPKATFSDLELGAIDSASDKRILQGSNDYKALLAAAERNKPQLIKSLNELTEGVEGARLYGARAKDEPGMVEKIAAKNRPPSTMSDYLGARIVVDSPQAMNELIDRFGASGSILESENFVHSAKEGYRAYHLQMALGDGTSAEIQLVPKPIADVMEQAHAIRQPFKRLADTKNPEDYARFKQAMTRANKLTDDAWSASPEWGRTTQADIRNLPTGEALMTHPPVEDIGPAPPEHGNVLAYRLGSAEGGLGGRNAGNIRSVASHLVNSADMEGPQSAGGVGNTISVYNAKLPQQLGEYQRINAGESSASIDMVGRGARLHGDGVHSVAYSFPKNFKADRLTSVSINDVNAELKKMGYRNADEAGTLNTEKALRAALAPKDKGYAAGGGVQGDDDNPFGKPPPDDDNPFGKAPPQEAMSWGDVAGSAVGHLGSSALNFAKDTAQPVLHPINTLEGIGNLALGSMQKAGLYGGDSYKKYPEALAEHYAEQYGGVERIKKTLATDPVGALADLSTILTLGGTATERLPSILGKTGKVMSKAGQMTDPLLAPVTAAKLGTKGVGHLMTHTGAVPLDTAFKTGVEGGEAGETFREHMRGDAPMEEPVEIAHQGLEQFRQQRGKEYRADMNRMRMSDTQFAPEDRILDFGKIDKAVDKAMEVQTFKGKVLDPGAEAVRSEMVKAIDDWRREPKATFHTAEGLDALKRKLGNMMMDTPPNTSARKASGDIYHAVKDTITKYYPDYAKTMKSYEQASGLIRDIESSLSLGKRANVDTSLRKLQSIMRNNVNTNFGRRMQLGQLLEENGAKHLMAALAGQSLNTWVPRGLGKLAAEGAALGVAGKLMSPWALATAPLMSPRLMGETAHLAGRTVGRGLEKSDRALGRVGLSNRAVGQIAYRTGRIAREIEPTMPALQAANRAGAPNPYENPDLSERLNVYPTMMRQ